MNHSTTYVSTSYTPSETNAFEGAKRLFGGCGYPSFSQCDFTDEESSGEAFDRRLCESKSSEHYGFFWGLNFTGKETDCETGLSYFGARYYDPTLLTSWTAIDPLADKYPSLSPCNYNASNPMNQMIAMTLVLLDYSTTFIWPSSPCRLHYLRVW